MALEVVGSRCRESEDVQFFHFAGGFDDNCIVQRVRFFDFGFFAFGVFAFRGRGDFSAHRSQDKHAGNKQAKRKRWQADQKSSGPWKLPPSGSVIVLTADVFHSRKANSHQQRLSEIS